MPTYEYECELCGHRFEVFQSMSELPLKVCPECKGPLKRLIGTGSGIIFKGAGFFVNDYKKKVPSQKNSSDSSSKESSQKDTSGEK